MSTTLAHVFPLLIFISIIVLNTIELKCILTQKYENGRRKGIRPSEWALTSLSIADVVFGISGFLYACVKLSGASAASSNTAYNILRFAAFFGGISSVTNLSLLAVERLSAVRRPIKHRLWFCHERLKIILPVLWIADLVLTVVVHFIGKALRSLNELSPIFVVPSTIFLIFCYFDIWSRIRKRSKIMPMVRQTPKTTGEAKQLNPTVSQSLTSDSSDFNESDIEKVTGSSQQDYTLDEQSAQTLPNINRPRSRRLPSSCRKMKRLFHWRSLDELSESYAASVLGRVDSRGITASSEQDNVSSYHLTPSSVAVFHRLDCEMTQRSSQEQQLFEKRLIRTAVSNSKIICPEIIASRSLQNQSFSNDSTPSTILVSKRDERDGNSLHIQQDPLTSVQLRQAKARNTEDRKIAILGATVVLCFIICYVPYTAVVLFAPDFQNYVVMLVFSNSLLNPIIYLWNHDSRKLYCC